MKVLFLGTSSDWPIPVLGCTCRQCASKNKKDKRTRAGVIINRKILLEGDADLYRQLRREGIHQIEGCVITHAHHSHVEGLHDVVGGSGLYALRPHQDLFPVWFHESHYEELKNTTKDMQFLKRRYKNAQEIEIGSVTITPFEVKHTDAMKTFGLKVEDESSSFVYIPDYKNVEKKFYARNCSLLAIDGTFLKHSSPGHATIKSGKKLAKELKADKTLFTHIGHVFKNYTELREITYPYGVAFDGLELEI